MSKHVRGNRISMRPHLAAAVCILVQMGCRIAGPEGPVTAREVQWLGLHVLLYTNEDAKALTLQVPELAGMGLNLLIAQIDYHYAFESHPELRSRDPVTQEYIRDLVETCRACGIRLIPEFMSLGHQSWGKKTHPLLTQYPQFDETPGKHPRNCGIYCRSWCPLHPELYPIVFDLYDELIEVFEADALHVGMDEVFLIGSEHCPRCRGRDPAALFAMAVQAAYDHIVTVRGKEMFMWGDRLLDAAATGYGKWEASANGTSPAIDLIPKDIVICDWHYETNRSRSYPSLSVFLDKGFRVLPTSYRNLHAMRDLIQDSRSYDTDSLLGHLCTTWSAAKPAATRLATYPPLATASQWLTTRGAW